VADIQARLRPQEALIEMFVDSEATHLALIRPDRWEIRSSPLPAAEVHEIAMMLYLNLIQNQSRRDFKSQVASVTDDAQREVLDLVSGILYQDPMVLLQELYNRLFAPLMDDLAGVTRLILCPHWNLHLVPFHAMGPVVAKGDLIINKMALAYCPSATIWARLRDSRPVAGTEVAGSTLILGVDKVASGIWWQRLRAFLNRLRGDAAISDFEAEAQDVAQIIGGQPIVGETATKERLLAGLPTAGIVHLSCHSAGDRGHPCLNGLLLADGLWSVAEILTDRRIVEVRASLISLSACRSGLDRLEPGDIFYGIGYVLLSRLATTLLTSLWPVDAEATHRLMVEVFHLYKECGDWAEALRQAQLATRQVRGRGDDIGFEDPYFWAGFCLLGD
jgi:CHAT domain-containing protein